MENVVVVLYHVSGLSNWIDRLNPYLKRTNLYILHFSKLQDIEYPRTKDYTSYDISYYSYNKLKRLILSINPSKCLFLTFRSVLDFTIYKLCQDLSIKSLLFEHGLMSADTLRFRNNMLKKSPFSVIKRQFWHIYKYMGYALSNRSCIKLLKDFCLFYLKGRFDLYHFEKYLLYSQHSIDTYGKIFTEVRERSIIIGYPIFADLTQKEEAAKYISETNIDGIVYVHQPLIADGVVSISYVEEKAFITEIATILAPKYGKMTLLLHPRADLSQYKNLYKDCDIDVIKSPNNYKVFANKKLVIGHYSTALLFGLYFEIPTVLIDYPTLKGNELFQSLFPSFHSPKNVLDEEIKANKDLKEYFLGRSNTYQNIAQCIEKA